MKTKILILTLIYSLLSSWNAYAQSNVDDFSFAPYFTDSITANQDTLLNIEVQLNVPDSNTIDSVHIKLLDVFENTYVFDQMIAYRTWIDLADFAYYREGQKSYLLFRGLDYKFYQASIRLKDVNQNFTDFKTK